MTIYLTPEIAAPTAAKAKEIVQRDGMPNAETLNVRPHYDPQTHALEGISFRRMQSPFFLFTDSKLVSLDDARVTTVDNAIAAQLDEYTHEKNVFKAHQGQPIARTAFSRAAACRHEANMFEAARKILKTLKKGDTPRQLLLG